MTAQYLKLGPFYIKKKLKKKQKIKIKVNVDKDIGTRRLLIRVKVKNTAKDRHILDFYSFMIKWSDGSQYLSGS